MPVRILVAAAAGALAIAGVPAHATGSTFVGDSFADCTRPPPPAIGSSSGSGSCDVTASSWSCTTAADVNEVVVSSPCSVALTATTPLFFVQVRMEQSGPVQVYCAGSGSGWVTYQPTPTSPEHAIPVTVTVEDQVGTFSGVGLVGVVVVVVQGTYTNACGGSGTFAGEVL